MGFIVPRPPPTSNAYESQFFIKKEIDGKILRFKLCNNGEWGIRRGSAGCKEDELTQKEYMFFLKIRNIADQLKL